MLTPANAAGLGWTAWIVSWFIAAMWRAPAVRRAGGRAEALHLLITVAGFAILFDGRLLARYGGWARVHQVLADVLPDWSFAPPVQWALFGLVVAGFLFCWWARIYLGTLWSGSVTAKADHRIVDTGPYALVRHPIYTGLLLSAFATAALYGTALAVLGALLILLGFWIKARLEERFLRAELGAEAYDAYASRVGMLVPGLR